MNQGYCDQLRPHYLEAGASSIGDNEGLADHGP